MTKLVGGEFGLWLVNELDRRAGARLGGWLCCRSLPLAAGSLGGSPLGRGAGGKGSAACYGSLGARAFALVALFAPALQACRKRVVTSCLGFSIPRLHAPAFSGH